MKNNQETDEFQQPDSAEITDDNVVASEEPEQDLSAVKSMATKGPSKVLIYVAVVLGAIAGGVWLALHEAGKVPPFYATVLEIDSTVAQNGGREFERNLIRLQNASRRVRPWKVVFTQDQINGWFSSDLPEKFPEAIPNAITDPRVVLEDDQIRLGFKYQFRGARGYVVLNAEMFCTDTDNEIAIRISDVKTGFVPLPVGPWLERVADSIRDAGIPVFWSRNSGTPVAIFTLPETVTSKSTRNVIVETIQVENAKLTISGKTTQEVKPSPGPQGANKPE